MTLSSNDRYALKHLYDSSPKFIRRIGVPHLLINNRTIYPNGRYLICFLEELRKVPFARRKRQILKLINLLILKVLSVTDTKNKKIGKIC
jgi:hypothetical protein